MMTTGGLIAAKMGPLDGPDPFDLTGRVALITGASSHGIGSASAKVLAQRCSSPHVVRIS